MICIINYGPGLGMSFLNSTRVADCSKVHLWLLLIYLERRVKRVSSGTIYAEAEVLI